MNLSLMLAPGGESGRAHQSRRELPEVRKTRPMGGASVHLVFLRIPSSLIAGRAKHSCLNKLMGFDRNVDSDLVSEE